VRRRRSIRKPRSTRRNWEAAKFEFQIHEIRMQEDPYRPRDALRRVSTFGRTQRLNGCDLGLFAHAGRCRSVRCGLVHRCRILVHVVNIIRQSRCNTCARCFKYIFRHSASRRARFYRGAANRSHRGHTSVSVACSFVTRNRRGYSYATQLYPQRQNLPVRLGSQCWTFPDCGSIIQCLRRPESVQGNLCRNATCQPCSSRSRGGDARDWHRLEFVQAAKADFWIGTNSLSACHNGLRRCLSVCSWMRTSDWALPDPKGQSLEAVRAIRDEIHERVKLILDANTRLYGKVVA
jgi:hypothetical protein